MTIKNAIYKKFRKKQNSEKKRKIMSKKEKTLIKPEIKMAYKGIQNLPITLKKGKIE